MAHPHRVSQRCLRSTSKSFTTGNDATPCSEMRTPIEYERIHHYNNLAFALLIQVS